MAKGPTTAKANPGETSVDAEIETYGGDPDLRLEGEEPSDGHRHEARDDDDRGAERKPPDLKWESDPRDALFAKIGERRAQQGQELSTEEEDDDAEERGEADAEDDGSDPEVVIVAGPGAREVNRPQEAKPAPRKVTDLQPDDLVVVKVDGAEVEMRYGDMVARAQKDVAADSRLEQAKALLAEVRSLKNSVAAPANEQRPGGQQERDARPAATNAKTQADRTARLTEIVDKLQTETPEKAVEALEGLISELRDAGNTSPADVQSVVRQTISEEESERSARVEIGTSYQAVADTYGDVLSDNRLAGMAFDETVGKIVETLRAAGTPDEDFQWVAENVARRNAAEPDASKHDSFGLAIMREYAKAARDPRFKLQPVKALMEDGLKSIRKWRTGDDTVPVNDKGKAPAPAPAAAGNGNGNRGPGADSRPRVVLSSNRSERKAGVSVQPRSASMRTDFSATGIAPRKDTSKTIADMAAGRR